MGNNTESVQQADHNNQSQIPDFETAMAELEALVQRMESGELSLEASLREFERGVQLTRICQNALQAAEQRVKMLDNQDHDSEAGFAPDSVAL